MAAEDYKLAEVDLLQMNDLFDEALEGPEAELVGELRACLPKDAPHDFCYFVARNSSRLVKATLFEPLIPELLVYAYRVGITAGSAVCMNDLGSCYYMGNIVPQDYARAAELYEMAMDAGCYQSIINLGYIWEYGRTGERNYEKAFQYYALAASLDSSVEATYKLGDMYARGEYVERNVKRAYRLWSHSLALADDGYLEAIAQPAARIGLLLLNDEDRAAAGLEPNPLQALELLQKAEIGLRLSIDDGQVYYRKRLAEVIEGQRRARELLDGSGA